MPVIRVEMFKRNTEQKRELVRELTNSFVKTCGGNKEAIKILITEVKLLPLHTIILIGTIIKTQISSVIQKKPIEKWVFLKSNIIDSSLRFRERSFSR